MQYTCVSCNHNDNIVLSNKYYLNADNVLSIERICINYYCHRYITVFKGVVPTLVVALTHSRTHARMHKCTRVQQRNGHMNISNNYDIVIKRKGIKADYSEITI